jgi:transcriptional regulator with XRE-family HTH domain
MTTVKITKCKTFWNELRVEKGFSFKDLEEIIGLTSGQINRIFTGAVMPKQHQIETICEFFDVPYPIGYDKFEQAHKDWCELHNKTTSIQSTDELDKIFNKDSEDDASWVFDNYDELPDKEKETKEIVPQSVLLELIYGKVPYSVFFKFTTLVANGTGNPLEVIYGQVSYEEYETIRSIIKNGEYPDSEGVSYQYPIEIPVFDKWGNVVDFKKREE